MIEGRPNEIPATKIPLEALRQQKSGRSCEHSDVSCDPLYTQI